MGFKCGLVTYSLGDHGSGSLTMRGPTVHSVGPLNLFK